jgi:hypothetical protein
MPKFKVEVSWNRYACSGISEYIVSASSKEDAEKKAIEINTCGQEALRKTAHIHSTTEI